ncbi:MAG: Fpg/Nei family DNA glycosylase [Salibacteraceae bacterium]
MPELPEVEIFRRYFERTSLQQSVTQIDFLDDKVLSTDAAEIESALVNHTFFATTRIGKYLFAQIDSGKFLLFHFGMTGSLSYYQASIDPPKFSRLIIQFDTGYHLAFVCPRKFGRIELVTNLKEYQGKKKLGPDFLTIDKNGFKTAIQKRMTKIKPALLEQKHFAGIGNWIADEMLFQAKIHPERLCKSLTNRDLNLLFNSGIQTIEEAIAHDTHYGSFPDFMFVNHRKEGAKCPRCGAEVIRMVVGGRGTFICTKEQRA